MVQTDHYKQAEQVIGKEDHVHCLHHTYKRLLRLQRPADVLEEKDRSTRTTHRYARHHIFLCLAHIRREAKELLAASHALVCVRSENRARFVVTEHAMPIRIGTNIVFSDFHVHFSLLFAELSTGTIAKRFIQDLWVNAMSFLKFFYGAASSFGSFRNARTSFWSL